MKRALDIILSLVLIIISLPIMVLIAILIKLENRSPIFFAFRSDGQKLYRVGQNGKPLRYFKFSSMIPGSDLPVYINDSKSRKSRITRVGAFIRRWHLDELPELFLVLAGKMSLVGPRPKMFEDLPDYYQEKILALKPGITGLGQVFDQINRPSTDELRKKLNLYYYRKQSLVLDIKIILMTILVVIKYPHCK